MSQDRWHLLSRLVVRRTGFPFELLERLSVADDAAVAVIEAAATADLAETAAREHALALFPAAVDAAKEAGDKPALRALSRSRRWLATRQLDEERLARHAESVPDEVRTALRAALDATAAAAQHAASVAELVAVRSDALTAELRRTATDPLFAEAVFLSNPDMHRASVAPLTEDPGRRLSPSLTRSVWAYLQRFAGKNDTASFFGPLGYAAVVPGQERPVEIGTVPGRWRRREIFVSYWSARAVAERIARDQRIRPWLVPRRHPMSMAVPPADLVDVHQLVDGVRGVAEIADKLAWPVTDVAAAIERLHSERLVIAALDVPSTRFHPFTALQEQIAALPPECTARDEWLDRLGEMESLRTTMRAAPFAERPALVERMDRWFTDVTGLTPRRNAGATYADRTLFYEECEGTHDRFDFSDAFATDLQHRLEPVLELSAAHASLLGAHYGRLGRAIFDALSPSGAPVPYPRFAQLMMARQAAGRLRSTDDAVESLRDRLVTLVAERSDGHVARLTRADVTELIADVPRLRNCHLSPDVMIDAPDRASVENGSFRLVLGEVHQVIYTWGSQLYFDDRRPEVEAECAAHIAEMPDYDGMAIVLTERRHKGLLNETFPGTIIEVNAAGTDLATERVAIADLEVFADGAGIGLRHRDTGRRHRLYMAGDEQLHLWALALPRVMPIAVRAPGGHTPRIELDGTVYQRERWTMPKSCWGNDLRDLDDAALLRRAAAVRQRSGLPRTTYLQVKSEPKPYYVDFLAPLSLRLLAHLAEANEELTFTEMLPGPDGLWLAEPDGRYCCEFRMTLFRH